jgi:hypothetical protein
MAENNKTLGIGKTVYLGENESFDKVRMPNGTVGSEQPAAAASSTVRASAQVPGRQVRVASQNPSSVRAATPQNQQVQPSPAQQDQQKSQFLRASKAPVTVVQDMPPEQKNKETDQPQQRAFVRASAKPIEPGPQISPDKYEERTPQGSKALQMLERAKANEEAPQVAEEEIQIESTQEVQEEEERDVEKENAILPETQVEFDLGDKQPAETKQKEVKPEEKKRPKFVDLSKLTVVNKTEIDKERDLRQALYNNKASYQIVAAQSGYVAKVAPLVHKDLVNILYSNLNAYEQRKSVYKTVHEKVFETSVGKMDFDSWLKNTTVEDMETFYYGIYASTFPNEGTFKFTCPKCGKDHDYKINHNSLIKTTDRDNMRRLIDEVSRNANTVEKMKQYSLLNKNQAIQVAESKLVFELRTPSLNDALEILRTVPEKSIDKDVATVTNMLYVNRTLIPSKDSGYTEETGRTALLRIIENLPIDDASELQAAVYDRVDENRISYSIKGIKCVDCSHEEKEIPVSIENILFTLIFEKAQQ